MKEILFGDESSIQQYLQELRLATTKLNWEAANLGLLKKISNSIEKNEELSDEENELFNKASLNDLFKVSGAIELEHDPQVKFFRIDRVLFQYKEDQGKLTSDAVVRLMRHFAKNGSEKVKSKVEEVYLFVANLLRRFPPVDWSTRWFWIKVIAEQSDNPHKIQWREVVKFFAEKSYEIFKRSKPRPLAYLEFLVTFFELDYAAILAKYRIHRKPISSSHSGQSTRHFIFKEVENIEKIPLAYLLLCNFNLPANKISEISMDRHFYEDIISQYQIARYDRNNPHENRLFSRIISLLLDVQLFVRCDGLPDHCNEERALIEMGLIIQSIRNSLLDIKNKKNEEKLVQFCHMLDVQWIRNLLEKGLPTMNE